MALAWASAIYFGSEKVCLYLEESVFYLKICAHMSTFLCSYLQNFWGELLQNSCLFVALVEHNEKEDILLPDLHNYWLLLVEALLALQTDVDLVEVEILLFSVVQLLLSFLQHLGLSLEFCNSDK